MRTGLRLVKIVSFALIVVGLCAPWAAAAYPEKSITMYCVFSPGGSMDASARALATEAEKILGQPIVIVTKDGGGGTVGLSVLATDKPDGYTLAAATSSQIMRHPLDRKVTYKPLASFTPIYVYALPPTGLMVMPDSPFKTLKDLVEHARKNPGQVKYATAGVGTPMHLIMELIARKEKIRWVHVPYKGTAPANTALLGGHVDAVSSGDVNMAISGQLRPLLMYTKDRYNRFPDVPTSVELGYGYYNDTLFSVFGPAGMDPAVVKKLEDAFEKALDGPAWAKVVEAFGLMTFKMKSEEYKKFLQEAWDREVEVRKSLDLIKEPATEPN